MKSKPSSKNGRPKPSPTPEQLSHGLEILADAHQRHDRLQVETVKRLSEKIAALERRLDAVDKEIEQLKEADPKDSDEDREPEL